MEQDDSTIQIIQRHVALWLPDKKPFKFMDMWSRADICNVSAEWGREMALTMLRGACFKLFCQLHGFLPVGLLAALLNLSLKAAHGAFVARRHSAAQGPACPLTHHPPQHSLHLIYHITKHLTLCNTISGSNGMKANFDRFLTLTKNVRKHDPIYAVVLKHVSLYLFPSEY